jgi:hypothetical protein
VDLFTQIQTCFANGWTPAPPEQPKTGRNSYGNNLNNKGNWNARKNAITINEHGRRVLVDTGEIYRTQIP